MKRMFILSIFLCAAAVFSCTSDVSKSGETVFGHDAVVQFDQLSEAQCSRVRNLRIFFQHASVGNNLYEGMLSLDAESGTKHDMPNSQSTVADLKTWYASNTGWGDFYLGNPGWSEKISNFTQNIDANGIGSLVNVAFMKFCYIDPEASFETYRDAMLDLETKYPSVYFVWWTMPICTTGSAQRDAFNDAVRSYCKSNGKILFDIADIESHDQSGNALSDAAGETLCGEYTTDGGHLNDAANLGRQRAAKVMWVLLSSIAD